MGAKPINQPDPTGIRRFPAFHSSRRRHAVTIETLWPESRNPADTRPRPLASPFAASPGGFLGDWPVSITKTKIQDDTAAAAQTLSQGANPAAGTSVFGIFT